MLRILLLLIAVLTPLRVYASTIQWESCFNSKFSSWFNDKPYPGLRCGFLEVPLQYKEGTSEEHPDSQRMVRLALTLLPAKGERKGSLVVISGGPGMPGINPEMDTGWPVSQLNESCDIVGYDPRGVGQSTPKINCKLPDKATDFPAREMLQACINHTGAEVLKHIGTEEAVSDVDRIRQALNDNKLTAIAYSYGTQVALLYAERFPKITRAIVLDGVVSLEEAKDDFLMRRNQARGYQQTFERFAAWCAKTGSCPLSSDKSLAARQYRDLLNQLYTYPLLSADGRYVTADDLLDLTHSLLLWRTFWPTLATAVRQLSQGIVSKEISDKLHDNAIANSNLDALNVINCADQPVTEFSLSEIRRQNRQIQAEFSAIHFRPGEEDSIDLCTIWPWKNHVHAKRPTRIPPLPSLFFIAQRYDPTTPWHNARAMATQFKGTLLTLEGDGHTLALTGENLCVDKMAVDYLLNPDKPRNDSVCR